MSLPLHTLRLVEKRLGDYCRRVCPPSFERQVRLGFRCEDTDVTLFEVRPAWSALGQSAEMHVDVARFRHESRGIWHFSYVDPWRRWRRYRWLPSSHNFVDLLRELDSDPHGVFWGSINGASLRWCSARGRCRFCDSIYRAILGNPPDRQTCGARCGDGESS